ncbi:MAG TPA: FxSxx-COOH system tetratricopeptide repeat protein, partial [Pilimelia sp.]|nr:FxSxx-COOH system tetratricopeptide repeat protein [Pilimelia sp.]
LVSHVSADRAWADWLEEQLRSAGYRVAVQDWRFQAGVDLADAARRAARANRCVLVVVSRAFVASPYAVHEWLTALAQVAPPSRLTIKVDGCAAPADLARLVDLDVAGADPTAARAALLASLLERGVEPGAAPTTGSATGGDRPARFPGHGPRLSNVPPRNLAFTGRVRALDEIHRAFADNPPGPRSLVIHGLGGVGKSQLALEFAHRHGSDYDVTWWVRADNGAGMLSDLLALARALGVEERTDQQQTLVALWPRLDLAGRWLLVFDGASLAFDLTPYWPHAAGGHLLLTSRSRAWTDLVATAHELPVLGHEEAVTFLRTRSGSDAEAGAADLAEQLGRLPLALEQAAAYVEETGTTLAGYGELLRDRAADVLDRLAPRGYPHTVTTTWSMSIQEAEKDGPGAQDLLRCYAFLAADDIPRALAAEHAAVFPAPLRGTLADPVRGALAVRALVRYSLVRAAGDALHVHRLVQAIVRQSLGRAAQRSWARAAAALLARAFPPDPADHANWPACGRLLPHVLTVLEHTERLGIRDEPVGVLLHRSGAYLHQTGDLVRAGRFLTQALAVREGCHGPQGAPVAETLMALARLAYHLGDRVELLRGRAFAERARAIAEAAHGPDHLLVAEIVTHLGAILRMLNDLPAARAATERGITIRRDALGPDHPQLAESYVYLGFILIFDGELRAAEESLQRALAIDRRALGDRHHHVGRTLKHLGTVRKILGRVDEAVRLLEEAVRILADSGGPDHIDTLAAENELADCYTLTGRLDEAAALLDHVLAIRRARHGEHPYVAWSLARRAMVLRDQGRLADAQRTLTEALRIIERACGPDDPTVGEIYSRIGAVLHCAGELAEARETLQRAVGHCSRTCSPQHPYLAGALDQLAQVTRELGDTAEADRLSRRSAAIRRTWIG